MLSKGLERGDCVTDRRIGQAGLEDLLGFFIATELYVEHGLGGEVTTEKFNVLGGDFLGMGGVDLSRQGAADLDDF